MRGHLRSIAAFGALCVAGGLASAANATDRGVTTPSFKVRVHGELLPRCTLTQTVTHGQFRQPASSANTARADTLDLPFRIDCNTGFDVSLASTRGGLRTSAPNTGGMFADLIAYEARVMLPGGLQGPACASPAMSNGCSRTLVDSELPDGVIQGEGRIALTLVPGSKPLLAGDYSDSLVMTVSPRLGGPPLL